MPLMILTLLKNNWRQIAIVAFLAGYTGYVYHAGALSERSAWQAKEAKEAIFQQELQKKLQNDADDKSKRLENILADQRVTEQLLRRKLNAEISKNRTYHDCMLPIDGVRLLNQAVSDNVHPK